MKYKILHLPSATFIYQTKGSHNFYSEEEIEETVGQSNFYTNYYNNISRLSDLLSYVEYDKNYFYGWNSIPEHFVMLEILSYEV